MALEYSTGTSQIAWYKLADLVARGEKERVLSFYRLLSHSFDDRAYTLQVEGDILRAFNDDEAITKYKQAALLYKKENKMVQALAVYEHLHTVEPKNSEYLAYLLEAYAYMGFKEKFVERWDLLFAVYKKKKLRAATLEKIVKKLVQSIKNTKSQLISYEWFIELVKKYDETLAMLIA